MPIARIVYGPALVGTGHEMAQVVALEDALVVARQQQDGLHPFAAQVHRLVDNQRIGEVVHSILILGAIVGLDDGLGVILSQVALGDGLLHMVAHRSVGHQISKQSQ